MIQRHVTRIEMFAIPGIPDIEAGDDLGMIIAGAMAAAGEQWVDGDIITVAQKIVSKAEGRSRALADIDPSDKAKEIAAKCGKDARKVQAILDESTDILRVVPAKPDGIVIARHRQGWICANAGIDESNLGKRHGELLLLPLDPDSSARRIADVIQERTSVRPGVVVTDTFGRPWRRGLVNIALGLSEVPAIVDWIGRSDAYGRQLQVSQQALADEIAAASGLLSLKDAGTPVTVLRNLEWSATPTASGYHYIRPLKEDLFQ
jgi:coenzyme F420-0:L-glutamate ligase/coenzyme F420-1:gamma-L-glutamate ligase